MNYRIIENQLVIQVYIEIYITYFLAKSKYRDHFEIRIHLKKLDIVSA